MTSPVAITGMGIISSLGLGIPRFRDALLKGESQFAQHHDPILSFPVVAALIQPFSFLDVLTEFSWLSPSRCQSLIKLMRGAPLTVQTALLAALEAWQQAELDRSPLDSRRIGLIIGAQNTTSHYQYHLYAKFQQQPDYLSPTYALHFMDSDHIGILSEAFGIRGEGFIVGGASASSQIALLRAYQLIVSGAMDACMVIGALADLSPMEIQGFHNLGALGGHHFINQPHKACRPFDRAHEGFIYGQAAACLIVESTQSAKKRSCFVEGYMLGGAALLDGNHLSDPSVEGECDVMQQAVDSTGIRVQDINYINTHGTASPLGDQTEIKAIETFLGAHTQHVFLNSTKSIVGHCLWSAGAVEAIATLLQIQEGFIHPTLNLDHPISEVCQFITGKSQFARVNTALSNGFGFGGINTTIVFSKEV